MAATALGDCEKCKAHGKVAPIARKVRRGQRLLFTGWVVTNRLILIEIFAGHIVLGDFVSVDFAFVGVAGIFHALYYFGFE